VVLLSFNTFAQGDPYNIDKHLASVFPKQMPSFVRQNSKPVAVNKKMQKTQYLFSGTESGVGYLREGDTVLVFRGQPWLSLGTGLYIGPIPQLAKAPCERRPMSPETQQVILQAGAQAAQQIFWRMSQQRW
jgi:hypothetical protein